MDPMTLAAILGAQAVGGIAGNLLSEGDRARSRDLINRAAGQFNFEIPNIEDQKLALEEYQLQGLLSSLMEQTPEQLQASAMEALQIDPRLKQQQRSYLDMLGEISKTGLTEADQIMAARMAQQAQAAEAARQASILQNMAARGAGGSGIEAAARLGSSQQAGNALAASMDDLRAQAFQNRLNAMSKGGELAGSLRGQEFNEQSNIAQSKDAVERFNLANRLNAAQRNIDRARQVEAANLAARQSFADQNVALRNQQQQYNRGLLQQQFQNRLGLGSARAGAMTGQAQAAQQQANATANMWGTLGSGVGSIAAAFGAGKPSANTQKQKDEYFAFQNFPED
jgi:hypothetical protein